MAQFRVTFEDVAFTSDPCLGGVVLGASLIGKFNADAKKLCNFPHGVCYLTDARFLEADRQAGVEIALFVSVSLVVEAAAFRDVANFAPPKRFLSEVAYALVDSVGGGSLDLDGHWEMLRAEAIAGVG